MKKYFVLIGAAILVMALASPGMTQAPTFPVPNMNIQMPVTAQTEFKTWGHIEVMTIWENKPDFNTGGTWLRNPQMNYQVSGSAQQFLPPTPNGATTFTNPNTGATTAIPASTAANYPLYPGGPLGPAPNGLPLRSAPNQDQTWRHVAERFRMHFQYGDAKTVRAVLGFEANSVDWGETPANFTPATAPGTWGNATGTTGVSNSSQNWANTSNHMGVYQSDMAQLGIMWAFLEFMVPNTPVQVAAGLQRFTVGGRLWMQNDAPGIKVRTQFAPHLVEFFWWRQRDVARNAYMVNDYYGAIYELNQRDFNVYAWGAYNNDLTGGVTTLNTSIPVSASLQYNHPWWLAAGGGYRPGNWDFSGQFVYNGGKLQPLTGDSISYNGWALEAAAKYRIGPGMFAGLEYFYSTGNDADKRSQVQAYATPAGTESNSIFGNDRTVFFWMNAAQLGYYNNHQANFIGLWYGRANFEFSPTAWVRFNLNYLYIGDNWKGTPGLVTTNAGVPIANTQKQINGVLGAYQGSDKRNVGQEINLITTFNIYKNFQYNVGLAIFLPGDVYDLPYKNADQAYAVNTNLKYVF